MPGKSSLKTDRRWTANELPTPSIVAGSCAVLGILGVLDYLTGFEILLAVFYLVPVTIAAWYAGRRWGLAFAFGSSLSWYFAETDEFGIILPATDLEGAIAILGKIKRALGALYADVEYTTCSVGAA